MHGVSVAERGTSIICISHTPEALAGFKIFPSREYFQEDHTRKSLHEIECYGEKKTDVYRKFNLFKFFVQHDVAKVPFEYY